MSPVSCVHVVAAERTVHAPLCGSIQRTRSSVAIKWEYCGGTQIQKWEPDASLRVIPPVTNSVPGYGESSAGHHWPLASTRVLRPGRSQRANRLKYRIAQSDRSVQYLDIEPGYIFGYIWTRQPTWALWSVRVVHCRNRLGRWSTRIRASPGSWPFARRRGRRAGWSPGRPPVTPGCPPTSAQSLRRRSRD